MSVYLIVEATKIIDKHKYDEYIRRAPQTIHKFAGRYLVRGGQVKFLAGKWKPERLIIIEFQTMQEFEGWWNSPEYAAVAPLREQGAETNAIVIEGL